MELCVQAVEVGWGTRGRCFQLVLGADGVFGLLLSASPPADWRRRAARRPGCADPAAAIARLAERYRRTGAAAALRESADNFVLRWAEVHEARPGPARRPEVAFVSAARSWLGRPRRAFGLETPDGRDPGAALDEIEWELSGRVAVRRRH
jgi:hypothetical protein